MIDEIEWRLHDVARDLSVHAAGLAGEEAGALQPLIARLDEHPRAYSRQSCHSRRMSWPGAVKRPA